MPDTTLSEKDNGITLEVPTGTRIRISLEENGTTGYRWSLRGFQEGILTRESDNNSPPPASRIGASGTRNLTFAARSSGTLTLTLKKMREWEPEDKAVSQFEITVKVK